jgi:hypothetical protein
MTKYLNWWEEEEEEEEEEKKKKKKKQKKKKEAEEEEARVCMKPTVLNLFSPVSYPHTQFCPCSRNAV